MRGGGTAWRRGAPRRRRGWRRGLRPPRRGLRRGVRRRSLEPLGFRGGNDVRATPLVGTKKLQELATHCGETAVMAQPRLERRVGNARLPGIDLPRVEVEDRRATLSLVDAAYGPARKC